MGKTREEEAAEVERALRRVAEQERNGRGRSLPPPKRSTSPNKSPNKSAYKAPSVWDGSGYDPIAIGETGLVGAYYTRSPDTRGRANKGRGGRG